MRFAQGNLPCRLTMMMTMMPMMAIVSCWMHNCRRSLINYRLDPPRRGFTEPGSGGALIDCRIESAGALSPNDCKTSSNGPGLGYNYDVCLSTNDPMGIESAVITYYFVLPNSTLFAIFILHLINYLSIHTYLKLIPMSILTSLQNQNAGTLDISPIGLRVKSSNGREPFLTPFQNIAVWSAVKFVVSPAEGGAAFLPLITDPENIDKRALFRPLRYCLPTHPLEMYKFQLCFSSPT